MKHTNRITTDTCNCSIDFEWQDEDEPRIHTPIAFDDSRCHRHTHQSPQHAWDTVIGENQQKNNMYGLVLEDAKAHHPDVIVDEVFAWSYDDAGILTVTLRAYPAASLARVQKLTKGISDRIVVQ